MVPLGEKSQPLVPGWSNSAVSMAVHVNECRTGDMGLDWLCCEMQPCEKETG
jgi:hypothetical protein